MSRKDYEAVAAILRPHADEPCVVLIARSLALLFAADNPLFDRQRFLRAAGVPTAQG